MKYIAKTFDGLRHENIIPVDTVSVWVGREVEHPPTPESITALIDGARISGQMQIYNDGQFHGRIDSFEGTPLFTNGQVSVRSLEDEHGNILWKRY